MKYLKFIYLAAAIAFIALAPQFLSSYALRLSTNIAIFITLAVSYNLINGVCGQFSLEPNGFVSIGAYIGALLLLDADAKEDQFMAQDPATWLLSFHSENIYLAMLAGGLGALALSLVLSFAVFRVRGDYLAIVTLGFGIIIKLLALNFTSITNGALGLNLGDLGWLKRTDLMLAGGFAIVAVWLILNLIYSRFGRAMKAVRDDEDAAIACGINAFATKTLAFGTSAFFEGAAGVLLACFLLAIAPAQFDFLFTFELLIIIVLGGLGSCTGAILGAVLVIGGAEWLRFLDEPMNIFGYQTPPLAGLRMLVFAALLVLLMQFGRRGLLGDKELNDWIKQRFARKKGERK